MDILAIIRDFQLDDDEIMQLYDILEIDNTTCEVDHE